MEVVGAANHCLSWNYRHAWGGVGLTCPPCDRTYYLGGRVDAYGTPDLIEDTELASVDSLSLTPLQRRTLDISLVAEEALWQKEMDLVRAAVAEGDPDRAAGLYEGARIMRGALNHQKALTLQVILEEHGIKGLPSRLRIARTFNGGGAIYAVDRGAVRQRAEVSETPARVVDLT